MIVKPLLAYFTLPQPSDRLVKELEALLTSDLKLDKLDARTKPNRDDKIE